ncbi:hypothetical protein [Candidatus Ichthyocystis sparus]|uniref:hypothetical protein n=1 Tax=Candidatus Ichthyocystis sparus TaxID=1561004 RepID=UPI000A7BA8B3|nr:hypothetical protein [Candidatus Ichthyocystis sparus]
MYNPTEGGTRAKHHLDGIVVTSEESGSVEGDNGEIPSSENVRKPKGTDPALTMMDKLFGEGWKSRFGESFGSGLLGRPTDVDSSHDPFGGHESIIEFFGSKEGESFLSVLAEVLLMLAKSSGQNAAAEREIKMKELMASLEENLSAAKSLADGAKSALIAGVASGLIGLVGAGVGMGANAYAARIRGQSSQVSKSLKDMDESGFSDLIRAEVPGTSGSGSTQSAADVLKAQREGMVNQIQDLEAKASKVTSIGEGVGRVSGSASGLGSAASTTVLTTAQAEQAGKNAVASQEGQSFHIEDEWQRSLLALRDTVLGIIGDAVRAMAQAQSSAFK